MKSNSTRERRQEKYDLQQYNFSGNDFALYKSQINTKAEFHLDLGGYQQIVMLGFGREIKIACLREPSFVILFLWKISLSLQFLQERI